MLEVLASAIRQEKEKVYRLKRKTKLFSDDTLTSVENHKEPTKQLLDIVSKFTKVTGYKIHKISIQK